MSDHRQHAHSNKGVSGRIARPKGRAQSLLKTVLWCFILGIAGSTIYIVRTDHGANIAASKRLIRVERITGISLSPVKRVLGINVKPKLDELFGAVERSDPNRLTILIDAGFDPNVSDETGRSIIRVAVESGCPECVASLVAHQADINFLDPNGATPLLAAIRRNEPKMVEQLLRLGADVNLKDLSGQTPLTEAISQQNSPIVDILIAHKVNVNSANSQSITPLMAAIDTDSLTMVERIVGAGANVNAIDKNGDTALMHAIRRQNTEILAAILARDVNVTALNNKKQDAAALAEEVGGEVAALFRRAFDRSLVNDKIDAITEGANTDKKGGAFSRAGKSGGNIETAATPTPAPRNAQTRLRLVGQVDGVWQRQRVNTLISVRLKVKNVGEEQAENVFVRVRLPGGAMLQLQGPQAIQRNAVAEYSSDVNQPVRSSENLRAEINCSNCLR